MTPYKKIATHLKNLIRQNKITYKEISERLNTSETTIKRALNDDDGYLNRLSSIAEILEIKFSSLVDSAFKNEKKNKLFNTKQEEFFALNPSYYHFYLHLAPARGLKYIRKNYDLTEQEIFKYLKKLDDIGVIELNVGTSFRRKSRFSANAGGKIHENIILKNDKDFLDNVAYNIGQPGYWYTSYTNNVSVELLESFKGKLRALDNEFADLASKDSITKSSDQLSFSGLSIIMGPMHKNLKDLYYIDKIDS